MFKTIVFDKNFVPKKEMIEKTGKRVEELEYNEVLSLAYQMLHDGEKWRYHFNAYISEDAYQRINSEKRFSVK